MGSFLFSREALIIGGIILIVVILYLYHRNASSAAGRTDFSEPVRASGSVGGITEYKDEYTDELSRATLFLDGGQAEVNFTDISGVEVDETFPEITLIQTSGKTTHISLGAYDLLVSQGEPVACKAQDAFQIRVWARDKLVYNEPLADAELGEGYVTGYTYDGTDVCLVFGSGLTLCAEQI